ncbi:putative MFS-type transporter EfpA [Nocardioides aquaticus]|uniref:MFS-type transporter EfpA n=1 Tax=Nocardioides aquaticus TaxID=160826 RepID=A0ABX8EI17_9ACTN|nr:MFS transporter [Nocardioides aquaticus]QVT80173.1 putative MFS-type transporter EfpA [Nocardioides aquaticus]
MSSEVKPTRAVGRDRTLTWVAVGTALVLVTYVTPIATLARSAPDLGAGPAARAWILSSMSVGLAAALLAAGVAGDTRGRRRVYLGGLVLMGGGAAVCALAWEPWLLVGARVVQGVGGAAVLACGLALLAGSTEPGPARTRATAVWGASVGVGITAGSLLALALDLDAAWASGWRETYAVTAVLVLATVVPTRRGVPAPPGVPGRVDLPGLALLSLAATALVAALTQGRGGVDLLTVLLGVVAVAALLGFLAVERRVPAPLLDPALLRDPRFRAATTGSLVLGLGIIGTTSYLPTLVDAGLDRGLAVATVPVLGWSLTSVAASVLLPRLRVAPSGPRAIAVLLVGVAVGQLLCLGVSADSALWQLTGAMVVAGVATGALNATLGREAVASVPPARAAMGSGANNTARYLGAACGITLFATVAQLPEDVRVGFDAAIVASAGLTLLGAATIASFGRRHTPARPVPSTSG